jgi:hypothetical protein
MPIISYAVRGRFGNNLFQYYATRILMKLLNEVGEKSGKKKYEFKYKNEIRPFQPHLETTPEGYVEVDDQAFLKYYAQLRNGEYPTEIKEKNIWMFGYYQFNQFLIDNIDFVKELFSVENPDIINDQVPMNQFVYQVKVAYSPKVTDPEKLVSSNSLYLHTRLDDFIQSGNNNNIITYQSYVKLIMDIKKEIPTIDTVIIVVDKVKRDFEVFYLTNLIKEISKTVKCSYHSGNMWQDFAMLYYAKNLVCSNSTFSWWAGLLGESTMNWFPDTMNYYDNQQFDKINDQTQIYKIDYWRN